MSDPFPCGSWPYHSVPDGLRGIRYSSLRFFALRVPAGHVLAVGSMVPKVTSVRQFRLNSSLYVSGPTLQVGPGLCALSFCVGRCRGEKGMRRGGEQHNYIFAFPSIHDSALDRWIRELSWRLGALRTM